MLQKLFFFLGLVFFKVRANLQVEVSRYYLNYLWWVLEPILTMGIFYVVFGVMMNRGTANFGVFMLVGLASWNWFQRSVSNCSRSIYNARTLLNQLRVPKVFFPLVVVFQDCVKQFFVMTLLVIFLVCYGIPIAASWISLGPLLVTQFTLLLGVGLLCAAVVPFFPDFTFLINTGLQLMFFATGIFYNIDELVLPQHRVYAYLNPMAGLLKNYREVLMNGVWPDWEYLGYTFVFGLMLCCVSMLLIRSFEHDYPRACQ